MSPRPVARSQAGAGSAEELQEVGIAARYVGPGVENRNARLDNNPINVIRSGSDGAPDDVSAAASESVAAGSIEHVFTSARKWRMGEEFHYWQLQNEYSTAFGQRLDNDYAAELAQARYAEDVHRQVAAIQRQNATALMDLSPVGLVKGGINLFGKAASGYSGLIGLGRDLDTAVAAQEWAQGKLSVDMPLFDALGKALSPALNRAQGALESTIGVGPTIALGALAEFGADVAAIWGGGLALRGVAPRAMEMPLWAGSADTGLFANQVGAIKIGPHTVGPYYEVFGHHPHQQASRSNDPNYDADRALAVADDGTFNHRVVSNEQIRLNGEIRRSGVPYNAALEDRVALETLVTGGMQRQYAEEIVRLSRESLIEQGASPNPTRVPGTRKGK